MQLSRIALALQFLINIAMFHPSENLNIPQSVLSKVGRNLHLLPNHPVGIISKMVVDYFRSLDRNFEVFSNMSPVVSTTANFDRLLLPSDHPARSLSDTYYFDDNTILRTHTSAHQAEHLEAGHNSFLAIGDVYRKDDIDTSHYPVFHQIEGVYIFDDPDVDVEAVSDDLLKVLIGLCKVLFPDCATQVKPDYFPFTNPSYQIDVLHENAGRTDWLEILGAGIIQPAILRSCAEKNSTLCSGSKLKKGWAFGIGLDRLAMILFKIPDIRLLWVTSEKFTSQFEQGKISTFKPYSLLEPLEKDISFWIPEAEIISLEKGDGTGEPDDGEQEDYYEGYLWRKQNDMSDKIREVSNRTDHPDIVESVKLFDQFYHPKKCRLSRAYRIRYSVPDPSLKSGAEFNSMVNALHVQIAETLSTDLGLIIR